MKSVRERALADPEFRKILFGSAVDANELPQTPEEAHEQAMLQGARCKECPLYGLGQGPVYGEIHPDSAAIAIGEQPGPAEVSIGAPFVGPTGKVWDSILAQAKLTRHPNKRASLPVVSTTNAALCKPPGFHTYQTLNHAIETEVAKEEFESSPAKAARTTKAAVKRASHITPFEACRPRLENEIRRSGAKVVLPLGQAALQSVGDIYAIHVGSPRKGQRKPGFRYLENVGTNRGYPFRLLREHERQARRLKHKTKLILPTYNPAFALTRAKNFLQVIRADVRHAARLIANDGQLVMEPPESCVVFGYAGHVNSPWLVDSHHPWLDMVFEPREFLDKLKSFASWVDTQVELHRQSSLPRPINTCDIETAGVTRDDAIRCIGLELANRVIVIPLVDRRGQPVFNKPIRDEVERITKSILRRDDVNFAGHNFSFDTMMLIGHGWVDRSDRCAANYIDTLTLHKNTTHVESPHKLAFAASHEFDAIGDIELWKGDVDHKSGADTDEVNLPDEVHSMLLWIYNAFDCIVQARLLPPLKTQVNQLKTFKCVKHDLSRLPVARDMSTIGLALDKERASQFRKDMIERIQQDELQLMDLAGKSVFNPGSSAQVAKLLFDEWKVVPSLTTSTDGGKPWKEGLKPGTQIAALMAIQVRDGKSLPEHVRKFIRLLVAYKTKRQVVNTFLNPILREPGDPKGSLPPHPLDPKLAWLRPRWNPDGTASGRWSSNPNVQNWPKVGVLPIRSLIVAPPGYVLIDNDFEQLELRIAAGITKDRWMCEAFAKDLDAHSLNTASMLVETEDQVWPMFERIIAGRKAPSGSEERVWADNLRSSGKGVNFAMQYGSNNQTLWDNMSTAIDKATGELVYPNLTRKFTDMSADRYRKNHPEIMEYQAEQLAKARKLGYVCTPDGLRKRYFIDGFNKENAPLNHPIQGQAAKMTDDALARMVAKHPIQVEKFIGPILQMHDELVFQVPEDEAETWAADCDEAFEFDFEGIRIYGEAEIVLQVGSKENLRKKD